MLKTLQNAWKLPELRKKLFITLVIIFLYRLGACIPVPYIAAGVTMSANMTGSILDLLNTFSGGALANGTLFALGVSPYITSSIVIQLLAVALPYFERLSKGGDEEKKILNRWTRGITAGLALITAIGYLFLLQNWGAFSKPLNFFMGLVIVSAYCAGACLVMWLAERINEFGIGNGISIILFANIIARFPYYVSVLWNYVVPAGEGFKWYGIFQALGIIAGIVAMVLIIIWISESERRIQVSYAKQIRGRKQYGGNNSNLPLKLNMTGVMPIIFANAIVSVLPTIDSIFFASKEATTVPGKIWDAVVGIFDYYSPLYIVIFFALIIAFAYFYVAISFNPLEVANNIQQQGGQIPGKRPGRDTVKFISNVLNRVTLIGALFICVIACVPLVINAIAYAVVNIGNQGTPITPSFSTFAFLGSSMIILVGVALETVRELEAQMTLRHYKGFL